MFKVLHSYLSERFRFSEEEFDFIKSHFSEKILKKGEFLQQAGDVPHYAAFVTEGCLRMYIIDDKSKEHIIQFAPETHWLSDTESLAAGKPTGFFIDAIENSSVLLLTLESHLNLMEKIPGYAKSFQMGIQKHASAKNKRIASSLSESAEEKYLDFIAKFPSLSLRVPQHMLASYLGITPETLSRVRKNIAKK